MDTTTLVAYLAIAASLGTMFGFRLGKTDTEINQAIDDALALAARDDE